MQQSKTNERDEISLDMQRTGFNILITTEVKTYNNSESNTLDPEIATDLFPKDSEFAGEKEEILSEFANFSTDFKSITIVFNKSFLLFSIPSNFFCFSFRS